MPGLSQIKKFSSDLLSIGDEITIRASRGEKPVAVEIPKTVEDKNDSEDFVLGMPEIEDEIPDEVDEDLSDLTGLINPSADSKNASDEPSASFAAPDLSSLLNPINTPDDSFAGTEMPDLSMFEDEPEEEIIEEEEEPEEISVGDMDLEALLAGGGFDQTEEEEPEEEPEEEIDMSLTEEIGGIDELDSILSADNNKKDDLPDLGNDFDASVLDFDTSAPEDLPDLDTPIEDFSLTDDLEPVDDLDNPEDFEKTDDLEPIDDFGEVQDFELADDVDALRTENLDTAAPEGLFDVNDFDLPDMDSPVEDAMPAEDLGAEETLTPMDDFDLSDMDSPVEDVMPAEDLGAEETLTPMDDFDLSDMDSPVEDVMPAEDLGAEEALTPMDDFDLPDMDSPVEDAMPAEDLGAEEALTPMDDFDLPDMDSPVEDAMPAEDLGAEEALTPMDDFDLPDMDSPVEDVMPAEDVLDENENYLELVDGSDKNNEVEQAAEQEDDSLSSAAPDGLFSMDDMELPDMDSPVGDMDLPDMDTPVADVLSASDSDTTDSFDSDASTDGLDDFGSFNFDDESTDELVTEEVGDDFGVAEEVMEVFDTSDMDGLDFGIPETDSQMNGEFELGGSDDFAMDSDFEIPGFSDVETARDDKRQDTPLVSGKQKRNRKNKKEELDEPDFTGAMESEELPPNTLTDEQYRTFTKNLSEYPLNVRLAIENLIVQDEFTDDAEFEVIEKVLNKAPARSVASMLEKMLDISIPVPRDFEHRSAEEYEAYKKSIGYQLKNRIIPAFLIGVVALLISWGLFNFGKNCVYKPLRAVSLYKQGYNLLQAGEYPQSEIKFNEAVKYRLNKNWFFNYARGYREHKQYQRAAQMYEYILYCFKHDKIAGLEYADMELDDLANYEKAEEIVRREVLDHHINDADGILMLGDIFLEWGTEKNPEKLESAREQYATLLHLYKTTDLYLSRMMRYFIRTDNLRQVLQVKPSFEGREKSLNWQDWTELSGYLLDKVYGPLSAADEYLRYEIQGLRGLLVQAVKSNPDNPISQYNLGRYFILSNENDKVEATLQHAIKNFNNASTMKTRDIYKYIDSYRLLGEYYKDKDEFLKAQEQYAEGIELYTTERDNAGFAGNSQIGNLYADLADIKYFISGDYDDALVNYTAAVDLGHDSSSIRYKIGYIQYRNRNYQEALGSFMKSGEGNVKEKNLMLSMANTLSLRGDDYAADGYYDTLLSRLDDEIAEKGMVFPQANINDNGLVTQYLYASNNYGVTLYRLAKRTGDSRYNAQSIVQFQQSVRAWDALTRNQDTLVRLGGSNLAEQNIHYITHRIPEYEPEIYIEIPKTLTDKEHI